MRIFTNQDATVNALLRADARLEPVSWFDPVAFGRLPSASDLSVYGAERSKALAEAHWDEQPILEGDFKLRAEALQAALDEAEPFFLLFGASAQDQLQLAQILCWLSYRTERALERIRLMTVDGPLSIFDDGALLEVAKEGETVDFTTLEAYREAWLAVTAPDPRHVEKLYRSLRERQENLSLAGALERWLQELPSVDNGLSISECQLLDALALGVSQPQAIFEAVSETEAAPFRVNWEYWALIESLAVGGEPALRRVDGAPFLCPPRDLAWTAFYEQVLELTDVGRGLLDGSLHNGRRDRPERWLGGVLLKSDSDWFWDYEEQAICRELPSPAGAG